MSASSLPGSGPAASRATPVADGLLRISLEAVAGAAPIVFTVEEARTVRTATSLRVRGTVIVETRGHRKVPLFGAELEFSYRQLRGRVTVGLVSGTVDLPLPNFGLFNDVSLHQVPKARIAVCLGRDLADLVADLEPDQAYLCFDHDDSAWAEGSQLSVRSEGGAPGVVLDPRDPAFYVRVENASLPGMCLLDGSWIGASASGWFSQDPVHVDRLGDQPGGRLTAAGTIDFEAVALTLDGTLTVGTKPDASGAKDECVVVFGGRGRVETSVPCHATLAGNTLYLEGASLSGDVAHDSANLAVAGRLAHTAWPLTDLVQVAGTAGATLRAQVSSVAGASTLECSGDLIFHAQRLPGADCSKLSELALEGAALHVVAGEVSLKGVAHRQFHDGINATGPVSVHVEIGRSEEMWRIVVRGDLRIGQREVAASEAEITASGMTTERRAYRASA